MNTKLYMQVAGVTGRILLAFLFVFSQSVSAGQDQNTKDKDKPKPAQKAAVQQTGEKTSSAATTAKTETEEGQAESSEQSSAEEKPSGDGKHEGIKVHGHWTIEVRNPDGTLVTHREFENSVTGGTNLLPALLYCLGGGCPSAPVATWQVQLLGNPAPCSNSVLGGCFLTQGNNLQISLPGPGQPNQGAFVLTGSVAAAATSSVTRVNTNTLLNAPGTGLPMGNLEFTGTALQTQVTVAASQIVQVTVVITFS